MLRHPVGLPILIERVFYRSLAISTTNLGMTTDDSFLEDAGSDPDAAFLLSRTLANQFWAPYRDYRWQAFLYVTQNLRVKFFSPPTADRCYHTFDWHSIHISCLAELSSYRSHNTEIKNSSDWSECNVYALCHLLRFAKCMYGQIVCFIFLLSLDKPLYRLSGLSQKYLLFSWSLYSSSRLFLVSCKILDI